MALGKFVGHLGRAGPVGDHGHFGKVGFLDVTRAAGAVPSQTAIVSSLSSILPQYELIWW